MKRIRIGVLTLMITLTCFFMSSITASAEEGLPGTKVKVTFPFVDIQSVDARITYTNREIFTDVVVSQTLDMSGIATEDAVCFNSDGSNKSGDITLELTIPEEAQIGAECIIALNEVYVTNAAGEYVDDVTQTVTVTVVEVLGQSGKTPGTVIRTDVDISLLEEQIKIAERIRNNGYSKDSWNAFLEALADARNALAVGTQEEIDKATQDLMAAMKAFVSIDYSKLQAAIDEANELVASDYNSQMWHNLLTALNNGNLMLSGDDQAAVDAAAAEITKRLEEVRELLRNSAGTSTGGSTVIEPTEDYCNIAIHNVWPVLFFVSLAGNIVLLVILYGRFKIKKKVTKDDTPLVDYEIGDDE